MIYDRNSLLALIAAVAPICKGNKSLPILCTAHLTLTEAGLRVAATNLELSLRTVMPLESDDMGDEKLDVCVGAARLKNVLGAMEDEVIDMEYDRAKGALMVRGNGVRAELLTLDPQDFPPLCIGCTAPGGVTMEQKELHRLLTGAAEFASEDATRYVLNGVHLSIEPGKVEVRATGTDGRRLGRLTEVVAEEDFVEVKEARKNHLGVTAILPTGAVAVLAKLLRGSNPCTVGYYNSAEGFTVMGGQWRVTGKCIQGEYPDVDQVIPEVAHKVKLDGLRLREMVEHVLPLAGKSSSVRLTLGEDGTAEVSTSCADVGAMSETVALVANMGKAPALSIVFNPEYLLSALPQGMCEFGYTDGTQPILIEADEFPRMAVVMPMRVQE